MCDLSSSNSLLPPSLNSSLPSSLLSSFPPSFPPSLPQARHKEEVEQIRSGGHDALAMIIEEYKVQLPPHLLLHPLTPHTCLSTHSPTFTLPPPLHHFTPSPYTSPLTLHLFITSLPHPPPLYHFTTSLPHPPPLHHFTPSPSTSSLPHPYHFFRSCLVSLWSRNESAVRNFFTRPSPWKQRGVSSC